MKAIRWIYVSFNRTAALAAPIVMLASTGLEGCRAGDGSASGITWTKESGIRVTGGGSPYPVQLSDGRTRLYYCGGGGISSAISEDGLTFTMEGLRLAAGCSPSVMPLPDGGYRVYYMVQRSNTVHVVHSAVTSDGLAFVDEGLRFENLDAPCYGWTSVPDAVRLPDGRVRLYFTCQSTSSDSRIGSAVSPDGLNFTMENDSLLKRAVDPMVLRLPDDTYRLFYATSPSDQLLVPPQQIWTATSLDGLSFTATAEVLRRGGSNDPESVADPAAIRLSSGEFRVYYGTTGGALSAISQGAGADGGGG